MLRTTIAAGLAFLFFLLLHFARFHYFLPQERVNDLLWVAGFGLIFYAFLLYILPREEWFQYQLQLNDKRMKSLVFPMLGVIFYAALFLGYLEFYFTVDRSITFRMLMIIDKEPNHSITREKMFARYNVSGIINRRFDDLSYGGYLVREGAVYHLTPKGNLVLGIYRFAMDYLHFDHGEKKG